MPTDIQKICDTIKALPDGVTLSHCLGYNSKTGLIEHRVITTADDLKALVAELDGLTKNISTGRKAVRVLLGALDIMLPYTSMGQSAKGVASDWLESTKDCGIQWTPISQLPEKDGWYWTTTVQSGEPFVIDAHFFTGKFFGEFSEKDVIAWMPYVEPQPYQKEAE